MFKNTLLIIFTGILGVLSMQQAKAQGKGEIIPTSCSCSTIFTSCESGPCYAPTYAKCACGWWVSTCGCYQTPTPPTGAPIDDIFNTVVVFEQNAKNFREFLNTGFNSKEAGQLKQAVDDFLNAYRNKDGQKFLDSGNRIESTSTTLPAAEKQRVNAWRTAHGASNLIP
jgi:hypothetical protein